MVFIEKLDIPWAVYINKEMHQLDKRNLKFKIK